jgi:hypothetical protein
MASPEARARQQSIAYGELNAEVVAFAESLGLEPPKVLERHKDQSYVHTIRLRALADFFRSLSGALVSVEQTEDGETLLRLKFAPEEEPQPEEEGSESNPDDLPEGQAPVEAGFLPEQFAPHGVLVEPSEPVGATVEEIVGAKASEEEAAALKRSESAKKAAATRAAKRAKQTK